MALRNGPSPWTRFRRSDGRGQLGATTVEFALVALPFLLLLGAIVEVGLMLLSEAQLRIATTATARRLWLGQLPATADARTIREDICGKVTLLPNCTGTLKVSMTARANFKALANSVPKPLTVAADAVPATAITGQSVALIATYDWNYRVVPMPTWRSRTQRLYALALFKPE